jgi:hypothetical protein
MSFGFRVRGPPVELLRPLRVGAMDRGLHVLVRTAPSMAATSATATSGDRALLCRPSYARAGSRLARGCKCLEQGAACIIDSLRREGDKLCLWLNVTTRLSQSQSGLLL